MFKNNIRGNAGCKNAFVQGEQPADIFHRQGKESDISFSRSRRVFIFEIIDLSFVPSHSTPRLSSYSIVYNII